MNAEIVSKFKILVPPLAEQQQITLKLEEELEKLHRLVEKTEKAVELINERRTALISAAVTGKIDVRNWQPSQAESPMEASV